MEKNISISHEDLRRYRALLIRSLWREITSVFELRAEQSGLTRSDLAKRLNVDKSVISRRLNGTTNITLEALSDLARALECKPEIHITPYENMQKNGSNKCPKDQKHFWTSTENTKPTYIINVEKNSTKNQKVNA